MVSSTYQSYCQSKHISINNDSSTLCKASLIVFELLLLGTGFILYSRMGVIPAAAAWGSTLIVEFIPLVCSSVNASPSSNTPQTTSSETKSEPIRQNPQRLSEDGFPLDYFNYLADKKIITYGHTPLRCNLLKPGKFERPEFQDAIVVKVDSHKYFKPYEKCAVCTPESEGFYYNASYVTPWLILATGPKDSDSEENFWKMIMMTDAPVIIRTCEVIEEQMNDAWQQEQSVVCLDYCPSLQMRDQKFSDLHVCFRASGVKNDCQATNLVIQKEKQTHQVSHYWIKKWSKFGEVDPQILQNILELTTICLASLKAHPEKPIVIHDDDGVGRAAVFGICLLLHTFHKIMESTPSNFDLDLEKLIEDMRRNIHFGVVDNQEQYNTIVRFSQLLFSQKQK